MSYQVSDLPLFSLDSVSKAPKITTYDSLDDDVIKSYMEFSLASMLYYAMKEGACSEQSSRMTAMDNASKNAGKLHVAEKRKAHLDCYSGTKILV